jgi:signal transduction histidine kinase
LTVTRTIFLGTLAVLIVVATLSVGIYRSAVADAVVQRSTQQLAMVRTAAAGLQGEVHGLSARVQQFSSLPSVQNLDVPYLAQRVEAAFAGDAHNIIRYIVRVDAAGRLYYWTPTGELIANGAPAHGAPERWQWLLDPAHRGQSRVAKLWWLRDPPPHLRAITTSVWRTAPSGEYPLPSQDFNGMLAIVIDLNRLVEIYLGPTLTEIGDDELVVGLSTTDFGVRMGPGQVGVQPAASDAHAHPEPQGTTILEDAGGRRLHAWSKVAIADEAWIVASSSRYERVAAGLQRSAMEQLGLTAALLISVPLAGWVIARRERRAQEEQRRLERRLAESQKMEAIGKLAGGIAHDFNNMLTAILGYSTMIHDDAPASSPVREQAGQIRRAAESAASLTQKLLAFGRRQVLQNHQVDFKLMLDNLIGLVRRVIGEHITVTAYAEPHLWPVLADHVQVEQSIVNLAINARDAMPGGGTLQIVARNAPRPRGERRADGDVRPGDYIQITVTDTGIGMDETIRARMFEPFFTTKPQGGGTGLGLSTVYGFVSQCGGYIAVLSTPGKGTSIELLLPRAPEGEPPPSPQRPETVASAPGHETVLVAEDEDAVRRLVVSSLERKGYRVIAAASGEEALQVAAAFDGTIDLLLTDVVMPGIKGPALAARLRAARPRVRVLLMSGYAADVVTSDDLLEATLLAKPFTPAVLVQAVRDALELPLPSRPVPGG